MGLEALSHQPTPATTQLGDADSKTEPKSAQLAKDGKQRTAISKSPAHPHAESVFTEPLPPKISLASSSIESIDPKNPGQTNSTEPAAHNSSPTSDATDFISEPGSPSSGRASEPTTYTPEPPPVVSQAKISINRETLKAMHRDVDRFFDLVDFNDKGDIIFSVERFKEYFKGKYGFSIDNQLEQFKINQLKALNQRALGIFCKNFYVFVEAGNSIHTSYADITDPSPRQALDEAYRAYGARAFEESFNTATELQHDARFIREDQQLDEIENKAYREEMATLAQLKNSGALTEEQAGAREREIKNRHWTYSNRFNPLAQTRPGSPAPSAYYQAKVAQANQKVTAAVQTFGNQVHAILTQQKEQETAQDSKKAEQAQQQRESAQILAEEKVESKQAAHVEDHLRNETARIEQKSVDLR